MHFLSTIKLIKRLGKGLITVKDLPFDDLSEAEVARIMRYEGWQYQALPKRFKTPLVLEASVLSRHNAVKSVGHENVTDELACKAIDKFGIQAFQALNARCRTELVCLHAIKNDPLAYLEMTTEQRTPAVSELALRLDRSLLIRARNSHAELQATAKSMPTRVLRPQTEEFEPC